MVSSKTCRVRTSNGKFYPRNRRFLRIDKMGNSEIQVNVVIADTDLKLSKNGRFAAKKKDSARHSILRNERDPYTRKGVRLSLRYLHLNKMQGEEDGDQCTLQPGNGACCCQTETRKLGKNAHIYCNMEPDKEMTLKRRKLA